MLTTTVPAGLSELTRERFLREATLQVATREKSDAGFALSDPRRAMAVGQLERCAACGVNGVKMQACAACKEAGERAF